MTKLLGVVIIIGMLLSAYGATTIYLNGTLVLNNVQVAIDPSTITAASCSYSDVAAAVASAVDGNTVLIPAGTCAWTNTLTITKAITLQGAGTNQTILQDNVTLGGVTPMIHVTLVANLLTRVTGIQFTNGARATVNQTGAIVMEGVNTDNRRGRVDHCHFVNLNQRSGVYVSGALGVTDSCTFVVNQSEFTHDIRHPNWAGSTDGDGSWSSVANYGTDQYWYVETCILDHRTGSMYDTIDTYNGARWVARYNQLYNCRFATHGTESTGRLRGNRAHEIYMNTAVGNGVNGEFISWRSGSGVCFSNVMTSWNTAFPSMVLRAFRIRTDYSPWNGAFGTNPWDENDGGNPFATGTCDSAGTLTMTDTGAGWAVDQWVGYSIRNATTGCGSDIVSNTSDTITFSAPVIGANCSFSAGNTYQINKVTTVLDQPGVGQGDLISFGTPAWPNETVEGCYEWDNTANGSNTSFGSDCYTIVENTHYFNDTAKPGYTPYAYPHPLVSGNP